MTKKELIIIKLGGSIVTLKHLSRPAIRSAHVGRIAAVLKRHYRPKKHALILIHGAGSFGHIHAHKYDLALGTKNHKEKLYRATENQSLDATLNAGLTALFIAAGLPVVGMPSRTLALNTRGKLSSLNAHPIEVALNSNAIPLLHGDMIFDTTWGLSVCSGDVLVAELARIFSTKKVFFASDVDGIFSQDPHKHKHAVLIEKTTLQEISNGSLKLEQSHNIDITGGLSKKFSFFKKIASLEYIFLFNGLQSETFSFPFSQKKFFGTTIRTKKTESG